jgi:hypothetical protein
MGAPLIANYQSAVFYPPNWIYLLLDSIGGTPWMAWGQAVVIVLHLGWAGTGMALLSRRLGVSELGQTISGLSYGMSGYLVARAGFLSINSATAWLPWILLAATQALKINHAGNVLSKPDQTSEPPSRSISRLWTTSKSFLWLAVFTGLLLLAGHAQVAWYTLGFTVLWAIYFSLTGDSRNGFLRSWGIVGLALLIGLILAAVQLFPTGEYLLESQRASSVDFTSALTYSFWPWHYLNFLSPGLFGSPVTGDYWGYANYWEDAVYIGLGPLILAFLAFALTGVSLKVGSSLKKRLAGFLAIVILISFLLAMGWFTPVFPWLYHNVPTFDMFQGPTRISLLAIFSLSLLAGVGADRWRRPGGRALYWSRLGTVGAASVAIGAGLAAIIKSPALAAIEPSLVRSTAIIGFWGLGFGLLTLTAPRTDFVDNPGAGWQPWHWLACTWIVADLVVANWGIMPGIDRRLYEDQPDTVRSVAAAIAEGRIYLPESVEERLKFDHFFRFDTFNPFLGDPGNWRDLREVLLPNISLLDRIPSANNFDPLVPGRYNQWILAFGAADEKAQNRMLDLMGVTIVEVLDSNSTPGVNFQPRAAYPRVRWVPCSQVLPDGDGALNLIRVAEINLENEVLIEGPAEQLVGCNTNHAAVISMIREDTNSILAGVNSEQPGYLVIANVWYPGWRAHVDGEAAALLRANYLFQGVFVPSGEHVVEISYHAEWFFRGALLSGIGWAVLVGLALILRSKRKYYGSQ